MTKYLAIFQIGPVQDFINCAKKTQDYLAGSLIISYLTTLAMVNIESGKPKGKVIYPSHDPSDPSNDKIYNEAKNVLVSYNKKKPDLSKAPLYGTVPNRFVATFDSDNDINSIKALLKDAEKQVRLEYINILKTAKEVLETSVDKVIRDLRYKDDWNKLWDRYLCVYGKTPFLEVYWVISPYEDESYGKDYKKAELLFGARKAVRNFAQVEEPGAKCTLCGQHEQLSSNKDPEKFWQKLRSIDRFKFRFGEGERLCAICTAKRLALSEYFGIKDMSFPSTSNMAISSTLLELAKNVNNNTVKNCIEEFQKNFKEMELERFPTELSPLYIVNSQLKEQPGSQKPPKIFGYDGNAFILDTYQPAKVYKEYGSKFKGQNDPDFISKVENAERALKKLLESIKVEESPKYYCVVSIDGDDMGKWLDGSKTNGQMDQKLHERISKILSEYASKKVPELSEEKYLAKIVYFGGDEGVILCSLEHILPMMIDLHEAYTQCFRINGKAGTNSMGVVIAHHQQSLLQVMSEARDALDKAKQVKYINEEKNAFCISLMKRSGGTIQILGKFEMLKHLQNMIDYYRKKEISPQWVYALDTISLTFQEVTEDYRLREAMIAEAKRILKRHFAGNCPEKEKESAMSILTPEIETIVNKYQGMQVGGAIKNSIKNLIEFEYLGAYIAKGGGR